MSKEVHVPKSSTCPSELHPSSAREGCQMSSLFLKDRRNKRQRVSCIYKHILAYCWRVCWSHCRAKPTVFISTRRFGHFFSRAHTFQTSLPWFSVFYTVNAFEFHESHFNFSLQNNDFSVLLTAVFPNRNIRVSWCNAVLFAFLNRFYDCIHISCFLGAHRGQFITG